MKNNEVCQCLHEILNEIPRTKICNKNCANQAKNYNIKVDVNNFETFTVNEYRLNLIKLGILSHKELIGEFVYYSKKSYGSHKVISWDENSGEFLLELEGQRFKSNPFTIKFY